MKLELVAAVAAALLVGGVAEAAHKQRPKHRNTAVTTQPAAGTSADPYTVYVAGTYAGRDPDPNIRAQLIREFGKRGGGK